MKNNRSSFPGLLHWMLPVLLLAMVFALAATPNLAHAGTDPGIALLAQIDAPASAGTGVATTEYVAPFYTDGAFIGGVIAAVMSIIAIWQNKEKKTAQKVSESLVQAIEVATKIPAIADKEKAIKASINRTVTDLGVQPLVHRLVKDVTL